MKFLSGYRTYLVALALVLYELLGYFLGKQPSIDVKTILEGLGLASLRAGISKAGT